MYINFDYDDDIGLNFKIFISANIKLHEANKSFVQYFALQRALLL